MKQQLKISTERGLWCRELTGNCSNIERVHKMHVALNYCVASEQRESCHPSLVQYQKDVMLGLIYM